MGKDAVSIQTSKNRQFVTGAEKRSFKNLVNHTPVAKVDSYTAELTDANKVVTMNKATANDFTVPPNSAVAFPVGTVLEVIQTGAGATTLVAGAGVTVNVDAELTLVLNGQYAVARLRKIATNTWIASGGLTPAA